MTCAARQLRAGCGSCPSSARGRGRKKTQEQCALLRIQHQGGHRDKHAPHRGGRWHREPCRRTCLLYSARAAFSASSALSMLTVICCSGDALKGPTDESCGVATAGGAGTDALLLEENVLLLLLLLLSISASLSSVLPMPSSTKSISWSTNAPLGSRSSSQSNPFASKNGVKASLRRFASSA